VPSVGARAPNPAAIAGAAKPVMYNREYEPSGVVCARETTQDF
jgi:hypothetical protein